MVSVRHVWYVLVYANFFYFGLVYVFVFLLASVHSVCYWLVYTMFANCLSICLFDYGIGYSIQNVVLISVC